MVDCTLPNKTITFSLNILIHVCILFALLTVFFIKVISVVIKSGLNNELTHLIKESIHNLLKDFKPYLNKIKRFIPLNIFKKLYKEESEAVSIHNKSLFSVMILVSSMLLITLITVVITLKYSCNMCPPLKELFTENIVIFCCVGIIEYLFFINIASKYIPAPPSLIIKSFYENIENQFS